MYVNYAQNFQVNKMILYIPQERGKFSNKKKKQKYFQRLARSDKKRTNNIFSVYINIEDFTSKRIHKPKNTRLDTPQSPIKLYM